MAFSRKKLLALGFGLWILGVGLGVQKAKADDGYQLRRFYNGISTVALDTRFSLPETKESSLRTRMAKILLNSKIINRDNINNIASFYLSKHLKKKMRVIVWNPNSPDIIWDSSTFIIRFDYSIWEQNIDNKKIVLFSITSHALRPGSPYSPALLTNNATLQVRAFIVNEDDSALQNNLKTAVDDMLDEFIHNIDG